MRQRPTLPHTFAYSTIGPAGLNFRVRDGNGWNPRGKITAKFALRDPSRFALRISAGGSDAARAPQFNIARRESGSTSCFLRAKGLSRLERPKTVKELEDDASQLEPS